MWVIQFNVLRGGERSPEDGAPREFLTQDSPFPLPDIDQTVLHRGEAFVVDDVVWDLERKTVTVELVPSGEADAREPELAAGATPADDSDEDEDDGLGAPEDDDVEGLYSPEEDGDEDLYPEEDGSEDGSEEDLGGAPDDEAEDLGAPDDGPHGEAEGTPPADKRSSAPKGKRSKPRG